MDSSLFVISYLLKYSLMLSACACSTDSTFHMMILETGALASNWLTPAFNTYSYSIFISFSKCICDGRETSFSKTVYPLFEVSRRSKQQREGAWPRDMAILVSVYGSFRLLHNRCLVFHFRRINHTKIEWLEFAGAIFHYSEILYPEASIN